MHFDIAAYLARIGLAVRPPVTLAGLRTLQASQLGAIACENLEPMLGAAPDLSATGIWNKLVVTGRGGSSLQLNTLLGAALEALGFEARPMRGWTGAAASTARPHLAWTVRLDGRNWLVDAGLGALGPLTPIRESDQPQAASGALFRVVSGARGQNTLQRHSGSGWIDLFAYGRALKVLPVQEAGTTSPSAPPPSPAADDLVVSLHRPSLRMSITNRVVRTEADFGTRVVELSSVQSFARTIRRTFRLNYSTEELQRVWTAMRCSQGLQATGTPGSHPQPSPASAAPRGAPGDACG